LLGVNRPGNRQLWIGDRSNLGSSTGGFFRIQSGAYNSMDAVSGNGMTRLPLNLGTPTSNVGVGFNDFNAEGPASKLTVAGNMAVGTDFKSSAAPADGLVVQGNVGIGTNAPGEKLSVAGTVHSMSGGFRFPDGSVQSSAAGKTFTTTRYDQSYISPSGTPPTSIIHLNLPAGSYLIFGTVQLVNVVDELFQDNKRYATCSIPNQGGTFRIPSYSDANYVVMSLHSVATLNEPTGIDILCGVPNGSRSASEVRVNSRRLTAVRIGDIEIQP
jgi:hypothetical protein